MNAVLVTVILFNGLETDIKKMAYRDINYALKHAVHDAALFVDPEALAEGEVIFDRIKGDEAFRETLSRNLPVNLSLEPVKTFVITEPIKIVESEYIDASYRDPLTGRPVEFPYVYEYVDPSRDTHFTRTLYGPSVVYVIETRVFNEEKPHQFITIQEYKDFLVDRESNLLSGTNIEGGDSIDSGAEGVPQSDS